MPQRHFSLKSAPSLGSTAGRWLAGERWDVPAPRPASTVMLVRDGAAGPEVFMLKRTSKMAFAPAVHVFPGGGVDPRDGEPGLPWSGPSPEAWAELLGLPVREAQMLVVAAVREVYEEVGVLLAGPDAALPLHTPDESWAGIREGLVNHELSLAEVLRDRGLVLRTDLLSVRAHWITPEFEPRRFDTWFFAALMPADQVADGETSEAEYAEWVRPADLLAAASAGQAAVMPPTTVCLEEIGAAPEAAALLHSRTVPTIMPVVVETPDGAAMRIEWEESS